METEVEWLDMQVWHLEEAEAYNADPKRVEMPAGMKAQDFMSAAQRHLRNGDDEVHRVDAIANAKRALDCRIRELLFVFGLDGKVGDLNVPRKLKLLAYLDLPAPKVLGKVNTFRNVAEHEFTPPSIDAVADFVDAVSLFLESTWWYIRDFPDEMTYYEAGCDSCYWHVSFDRNLSCFTIHCYRTEDDSEESSGTLDIQDARYLPYLRAYIALLFGRLGGFWDPKNPDNPRL